MPRIWSGYPFPVLGDDGSPSGYHSTRPYIIRRHLTLGVVSHGGAQNMNPGPQRAVLSRFFGAL